MQKLHMKLAMKRKRIGSIYAAVKKKLAFLLLFCWLCFVFGFLVLFLFFVLFFFFFWGGGVTG